jgi:RNA polymerase sigma-70 factor (ECF subfamily)
MSAMAVPHPSWETEEQLVTGLRSGDDEAFVHVVRRYGGPLLATARRYLRNEEDARDVLQESLLRAHQAIDRFEGGSTLSTWLHRIVINSCLMRLRRSRRHPEDSIEELLPVFLDEGHSAGGPFVSWSDDAISVLERKELCARVRGAIDRLPETYRTVLLLRDLEELDTAEVAGLLGVTENAVKIRLHRARQALRTLLDQDLFRSPSCPA